ncbi:histidine ammonia-lyase-like [Cherax quadricarinatus]
MSSADAAWNLCHTLPFTPANQRSRIATSHLLSHLGGQKKGQLETHHREYLLWLSPPRTDRQPLEIYPSSAGLPAHISKIQEGSRAPPDNSDSMANYTTPEGPHEEDEPQHTTPYLETVLEAHDLKPVKLGPKEGIALINGTQLITSMGAEAVERAETVARQADVVAALSLEVLKGTSRAFDSDVHKLRHHKGQMDVARRIRALLHSDTFVSEIAESHRFCDRVQDAYTLRCTPQVHGIVHDTLHFVRGIITDEMNSATDNPLVISERKEIISAGNFHGEYPAKAVDYLAIAIHEIANMSERRIERLVNPALSELPAFLVSEGGLNSGFMIAHCTAAALVSENKVLCHPASVDSLTTSAGTEDHVSMGGFGARKALMVVENVERVIAIELMAACQAIEFLRPLKTTTPLEEVIKVVRSVVRPYDKDRFLAPDIDTITELLKDNKIWLAVRHHIEHYHSVQHVETRVFSPSMSFIGSGPPRPFKRSLNNGRPTRSPATKTKRQRTCSKNN